MAKQTFTTGQVLTAAQMNSLQSNDFNQTVSVKTASYTLVAADKGTRIEFNTSGSVTCTVNTGLFDAGDTLIIQNRGAGDVTVTAGTATVNTSATLVLSQYDAGTLYFVSASAAIFFNTDAGGAGGGGKVLQVVSTTKSDTFSTSSTSFTDITGLSVSITPSAVSSQILVLYDTFFMGEASVNWPLIRLMRDSTAIKIGDASGSLTQATGGNEHANDYAPKPNTAGSYLDSPATTSSTTYKMQIQRTGGSGSVYVNQTTSSSEANRGRYASTITVMEIGA